MYKWTDRVRGELYRPVNIVKPLSVQFDKKVSLNQGSKIHLRVRANHDANNIKVQLYWNTSSGLEKSKTLNIPELKANQSTPISFDIPNIVSERLILNAQAWEDDTKVYNQQLIEIEYPHIPTQVVLPQSQMTLINTPILTSRKNFGYIIGSGDEIPQALKEMGCKVTLINPKQISKDYLATFDGIIVGIRAFNKVTEMKSAAPILNQYVHDGGFVLVQYNTNRGLVTDELGPYPFKLSRTRVTEEDAPPTLLEKNHPILMIPNSISNTDFNNWVQERGLYFAESWDKNYTPIIGWNDTGEELAKGSILTTNYGKGHYVFTGISFFRQLPAGILGAYKLFGNIISYGKPMPSDPKNIN